MGTPDDTLEQCCGLRGESTAVGDVSLDEAATTSTTTEKRRYWRARPADGTRVSVTIRHRGGERVTIGATHTGLDSPEDVGRWRAVRRERLGTL